MSKGYYYYFSWKKNIWVKGRLELVSKGYYGIKFFFKKKKKKKKLCKNLNKEKKFPDLILKIERLNRND